MKKKIYVVLYVKFIDFLKKTLSKNAIICMSGRPFYSKNKQFHLLKKKFEI